MPLTPPQRDANGEVAPHDHPEILGGHKIIRRISRQFITRDEKSPSGQRISTMAFQASTSGNKSMSVDLEQLMIEAKVEPRDIVTQPPFIGSVWFEAAFLRSEAFSVGYDPLPDNIYHGGVWGSFSRSKKQALLDAAQWYVEISDSDIR